MIEYLINAIKKAIAVITMMTVAATAATAVTNSTPEPGCSVGEEGCASYATADCFEDEAVVRVVSNFEGGEPFEYATGEVVCAAYDDINAGNRPADWRQP